MGNLRASGVMKARCPCNRIVLIDADTKSTPLSLHGKYRLFVEPSFCSSFLYRNVHLIEVWIHDVISFVRWILLSYRSGGVADLLSSTFWIWIQYKITPWNNATAQMNGVCWSVFRYLKELGHVPEHDSIRQWLKGVQWTAWHLIKRG